MSPELRSETSEIQPQAQISAETGEKKLSTMEELAQLSKSQKLKEILEDKKVQEGLKLMANKVLEEKLGKEKLANFSGTTKEALNTVLINNSIKQITEAIKKSGISEDALGRNMDRLANDLDYVSKNGEQINPEMQKLGQLIKGFSDIAKTPANPNDKYEDMDRFATEASKYFSGVLDNGTYFKNLDTLSTTLGNVDTDTKEKLNKVLEKKVILDELLNNGKYEGFGVKIDLSNPKINEWKLDISDDINTSEAEYLKGMVNNLDNAGTQLNEISLRPEDMAKTLYNLQLSPEDFSNLKEKLGKIPVIGPIIQAFIAIFTGEEVEKKLYEMTQNKKIKDSLKNLSNFEATGENKSYTKLENPDEVTQQEILGNASSFLRKVDDMFISEGGKSKDSIIAKKDFWKDAFTLDVKDGDNSLMARVRNEVKLIMSSNPQMNEKELFDKLSKISLTKVEQKEEQEGGSQEPLNNMASDAETEVTQESPERKKANEITAKLVNLVKLENNSPITIELDDGTKTKIGIKDGKELILGEDTYSISLTKDGGENAFEMLEFKDGELKISSSEGVTHLFGETKAEDLGVPKDLTDLFFSLLTEGKMQKTILLGLKEEDGKYDINIQKINTIIV